MTLKKLSQHESKVNYRNVQLAQDEKVEKQGVGHGEMFNLLKNNKCDVTWGIIGFLGVGTVIPLTGYVLSRAFVHKASGHYHQIWYDCLKWSFTFLAVSFANGFLIFIKLCKLETLGSAITCNMRKRVV